MLESSPDQLAFSDLFAYVRYRGSAVELMVPLDRIGNRGYSRAGSALPRGKLSEFFTLPETALAS